jgi:hypothetical protein
MTETNDQQKDDPRIFCFENTADEEAVETSVAVLIGEMQDQARRTFVSEHNILRLNHGRKWAHTAREPEADNNFHTISAEWVLPFDEIAKNDLGLIGRAILPMNEEMEKQFAQSMYKVVGAAAEKVGNLVDAREAGSFAHSMLEMLNKIELGVDRDGTVRMPQIHAGADAYERIVRDLANVEPELQAEIERVKAEKIEQALERERERKAKFKRASL